MRAGPLSMQAQRAPLPGGRWHFQHGPIDIVIGADGEPRAVEAAHLAAWVRFESVLGELVAELAELRLAVRGHCALRGVIARRMWQACFPHREAFITPMAAVAGSVAQELIACYERPGIARAWVNNGGDIALHLAADPAKAPEASVSLRVGLFADLARFDPAAPGASPLDAAFDVHAHMPVRGIATSGWRGRSFSLGIADSVTVLARTAAMADAAATVIANAVTTDDSRVQRRPANALKDDTDLGELMVTVAVPRLPGATVHEALLCGQRRAWELRDKGLIAAAALVCQGELVQLRPDAAMATSACSRLGSVFA